MSDSIGKVHLDLTTNYSEFDQQLNNISGKATGKVSSAFGKLGKVAAAAFAVKKLIQFGSESIKLASDLQEVQNVVDVVFGKSSEQINNFAKTAITSYGLSELSAKKYSSTMGAMLKSMGLTDDAVLNMSQSITALTGDMASFYNLDADTAFQKIRAGISGEIEPLRQLGINMSIANLEAFALSKGITKSYQSMTQSEQALLRYNYLLSTTSDAQGDFARTSNSWANQTRILTEQFNTLKATLGSAFMSVLTPVVKMLNWVISKLQIAANYFKAFVEAVTGVKTETSSASSGMEGIADSATEAGDATVDAAKRASKALAGFDRLNVLSSDDGSGSGGSGGGSIPGLDIPSFEGTTVALPELDTSGIDEAVESIKTKFFGLIEWGKETFAPSISAWGTAFSDLKQPISEAFESIKGSLKTMWDDAFVPFGTYFAEEFIPGVVNPLNESLAPAFAQAVSGIATSFSGLIANTLAPLISYILNDFITPILEGVRENFVPIFSEILPVVFAEFTKDFKFTCEQIGKIVEDIVKPAFESVKTTVVDSLDIIGKEWEKSGDKLLSLFTEFKDSIKEIWDNLYNVILKPVWDAILGAINSLWEKHLKPMTEKFMSFVSKLGEAIMTIWNNFLAPIVNWIIRTFGPLIVGEFKKVINIVKSIIGVVSDVVGGIFDWLGGLLDFITGVFSGDWKKAWNGLKNAFKGIWDAVWAIIKGVINLIIGGINSLWSGLYKAVKGIVDTIGKVAGVIGDLLGQNWKFSMPDKPPTIPKLARGGIIDQPTLAMVGERGKEAVVPLENTAFADSIANAIMRVLMPLFNSNKGTGKNNEDGTQVIILKVGEYELGRITVGAINKYHNVIGKVELEV